ncbi:DNA helicase [Microbacterium phage Johann]|uniref:DNA helicase n=2 Tax=Goodmanvirus goodman TaxID=2734238 RepID=A0A3G3LZP2_9CAUD|nr:DNA helicase [Microbacterium phage Goodman]AYQ99490.1 DNA helicase [Microbacterium phage Goodman]AYQ99658.1 DNA helicase [Microbacterium phage Johann]
MTRPAPYSYQQEGINRIRAEGRLLLADEPGLGKTRQAIEAYDGGRVLVIAPKLILDSGTWDDEIAKWSDHPELFTQAAYTEIPTREWTGAKRPDGSPNLSATRGTDMPKREFLTSWDALVLDEAHYVKGRATTWTKAIQKVAKRSGGLLALTGTPMPNWAHEVFTLLQLLYPEEAGPGKRFGAYQRWLNEWFIRTVNPFSDKPGTEGIGGLLACGNRQACKNRPANDPCEHWLEFAEANLSHRFLRRLRDDVLGQLPPLTEEIVEIPMDAEQKRMYRELKKDWVTETKDGEEVVTWTVGSRNVLMDRITTSGWFASMSGEPRGGKLERLRYDLESRSQPTLVLAHYRDSVEACARVAESTGARAGFIHGGVSNAGQVVKDFKSGKIDVLVGSLETVSEGLTLTQADMAIFVEKSYKPSRNEQAMRRVHRIGQTRPVTVLDYVTPHSLDSNKRALLAEKTDQQMRALTAGQLTALL